MKAIRRVTQIAGVIAVALIASLAVTVLSAPEGDWTELAETIASPRCEEDADRQIDWDSLPDEVVAWVEVPGTNIDEPIVQATPDAPNAYLYRDVFEQGAYGTPYIDCECSVDSRFVMVYGHHMSDGSVFADFADFIDEAYAREHDEIILYRREGATLHLESVAVDVVNASHESLVIDQKADFRKILDNAGLQLESSEEPTQLFAFTTCSYQTWNSRTTVYAAYSSSEGSVSALSLK